MGCVELVVGKLSSSSLLSCCDRLEREGTRMRWRVRPERKREREVEREKKIKYTSYSNRAYMHDYCSKVYKYTILYPLMWVFFLPKSVK